jgi:3-isopropylmalate/(R)-2-methylmalate dehydratase small subunit
MEMKNVRGRVAWIFAEENFDVDQIIGVKNIKITDIQELAAIAMSDFDPEFAKIVRPGDLLVGGVNFGYGHPHYPPIRAVRHLGIAGIIAESFSPGFYRGEISNGFPLLTCPGILNSVERWDELRVDWKQGIVVNHRNGQKLPIEPLARSELEMIETGGLVPYLKKSLGQQK